MSRNPMQKQKLLYLRRIMLEKTDENHGLTSSEILAELAAYGIQAERKSLYDDLQVLEKFGMDICKTKSSTVKYYVGSRDFELPELKLLVDAIQSSKFITEKKSFSLIHKLEGLASVYEGKELQRQVVISNRAKTMNERIYYLVDNIQNAIATDRKISFRYYRWELDYSGMEKIVKREKVKVGGYVASPWSLCWDDENYYLIAYDSSSNSIKHYRVDKMDKIRLLDEPRDGGKTFEKFDLAGYSKGVFSMFGGTKTNVRLSVDNDCVGVIADRFGKDIYVTKESDSTFSVSVDVMTSKQFYAWVFGLGGKVRIISPQNVVDEFKKQLENVNESF
ncbi:MULTISPECIES: YafY family protein [Ruminococcus]|nr:MULTISPECIES: WYL domain-containing protein [Ruminococcus]